MNGLNFKEGDVNPDSIRYCLKGKDTKPLPEIGGKKKLTGKKRTGFAVACTRDRLCKNNIISQVQKCPFMVRKEGAYQQQNRNRPRRSGTKLQSGENEKDSRIGGS